MWAHACMHMYVCTNMHKYRICWADFVTCVHVVSRLANFLGLCYITSEFTEP